AAVAAAVATGAASSVAAAIASAVATSAAGATGAAGTAGASSAAAGAANASSAANAANTSQSNTSQTDASQSNSESSNVEGDSQSQGENQTQNMTEMDVSVDSQLGQGGPNIAINKLGGATEMTMPTIALDNRPDWDTATEEENEGPSFADILALTELFGTEKAEDSGAADSEKKVAQAERRAALQAKLEEQASALPGTLVEYTTGMVIEKLGELLEEIQVVGDLLAFAWSKSVELSEYYKEIQADPGESFAVPLVNHEVVSEQAPSIELKLKEQAIGNLEININAGIVVDGVLLQVENGKITGLKIGNAIASGSIEILGQTLVEAPEVELELPGVISLGEGIPLFGINPETAGGETA
ncbi:MAG: hypothetical protein ACO4AI_14370, partial [Prochlorothrix sp.]